MVRRQVRFGAGRVAGLGGVALGCLALANCTTSNKVSSRIDPKYGVSASPRVVEPGQPVPKGGGTYRVGKPYVVAGRTYYPVENKRYRKEGIASWYGEDFHGRLTANGEVYDMEGISAAHPTLPMPSYARVTNLHNGRSLIVRVNDRGPYHGEREIDLSSKAADLLNVRRAGTGRVRVEYVGAAALEGSDDRKLVATLRDGRPAPAPPASMLASAPPAAPQVTTSRQRVALSAPRPAAARDDVAEERTAPALPVMPQVTPPPQRQAASVFRPAPARADVAEERIASALPVTVVETKAVPRLPPNLPAAVPPPAVASVMASPLPPPLSVETRTASRSAPVRTDLAPGTREQPRLVWSTGPAPIRTGPVSAYAQPTGESAPTHVRGLY